MAKVTEQKKNDIQPDFQIMKKFLWLRQNFAYCLLMSTILWIVGLCYYIGQFIGWSSVLALGAVDFSIFILSVVMPLFFVWFILAYIERSSSLDANAVLFQRYINNLMYPDEDASELAKAFSKVLQEQIRQLQKENKAVLSQSSTLKDELDARITELSDILQLLDRYSATALTELNAGVKTLADKCSYVTDKTKNSAAYLKECSKDISQSSSEFLSKITPVLDEISAVSSNIRNSVENNDKNLSNFREQLNSCAALSQNHINEMLSMTGENAKRIERSFYKTAEEYDALCKRLDASVSNIEGRIDEQQRLLQTQAQVLDHNSQLLDTKLVKYGKSVSAEIDKLVKNSVELEKMTKRQLGSLKTVNTETGKVIRGIGGVFDEKRLEIEQRCEYAVNSMQNVIIAINKETEKLVSFTNLTQAKNLDLQNISEAIVDKIGDMSSKLALKTDTLKDKAVDVIDKFTQASELINKSTDKIALSSSLIVDNSKTSVKLLEDQNFYITNALANIDLVKEKLGKLQDDVKKIAQEANKTLELYEKKANQYENLRNVCITEDPAVPDFDPDKTIAAAKAVNRSLLKFGINSEKMFGSLDMFDLWEVYLNGQQNVFTDILVKKLTRKQVLAVRRAFDDDIEFHNTVIRYLFLMDILIKEMSDPSPTKRKELINLSVNSSLDKVYFILVRTLNYVD